MVLVPERLDDDKLLEAIEKATKVYHFCPNRVWATIENSTGKEQDLHVLFPPVDPKLDILFRRTRDGEAVQDSHDRCTFDFCEQSLVNSTSVVQRHESRSCAVIACEPVAHFDIFPAEALNEAAKQRRPTAWHLYGRRITQPHHKYMAISHVWSDGTGAGNANGKVNECLFDFFRDIALELRCEGIWWDTLCIPSDKKARALAIQNMHENYEHAHVTLVHDCFLRTLPWTDAETACLAIIMSPWFSRGWTALELAKSRTVKVLFKGERGYILKDLDDDILQNPQTARHRVTSDIIRRLRTKSVRSVDDLLSVLRARYTSWTKDMAIISALLVGAAIEPEEDLVAEPQSETAANESVKNIYQQEIFEKVVKHIGRLEYGHLFHNLPTMFEGASWCPARFLSLPPNFSGNIDKEVQIRADFDDRQSPPLLVDSQGDVIGHWIVLSTSYAPVENCDWKDVHPLIAAKIRSSLKKEQNHRVLVEPFAKSIVRFLVVRTLEAPHVRHAYRFIGSVRFKTPQKLDENQKVIVKTVILNRFDVLLTSNAKGKQVVVQFSEQASGSGPSKLVSSDPDDDDDDDNNNFEIPSNECHDPLSVYQSFGYTNADDDFDPGSRLKRPRETPWNQDLLTAAREGRDKDFLMLLAQGAEPGYYDEDLRTPMSWAAAEGYVAIVKMILAHHQDRLRAAEHLTNFSDWKPGRPVAFIDHISRRFTDQIDSQDQDGQTPLAWAAIHGHTDVVRQLILRHEIKIDSKERHRWTPLAFAAAGGHDTVVKTLIDAGANINTLVRGDVSILGLSVRAGHLSTAKLLLDAGAQIDGLPGGRPPLLTAAATGSQRLTKLLMKRGANLDATDLSGPALYRAAAGGHLTVVKLLLKEKDKFNINAGVPLEPRSSTPLVAAVLGGKPWSPFSWSPHPSSARDDVRESYEEIVRLLLETGAFDVNVEDIDKSTPLHKAASRGYARVLKLLLDTGQAKVDAQMDRGMTPLFCAARSGHETIVKLLLNAKASANIESQSNGDLAQTPMSIAQEYGHHSIAGLLKPHTSISNRLFGPAGKFLTRREAHEGQRNGFNNF